MAENGSIDNLSIQISTQADSAVKGLERLAQTMERLRNALGGLGNGFSALSELLRSLSEIGQVRIPITIPRRITEIGAAIRSITDDDVKRISDLAQALQMIAQVRGIRIPRVNGAGGANNPTAGDVQEDQNIPGGGGTQRAANEIARTTRESNRATSALQRLGAGFRAVGRFAGGAAGHLLGFLGRIMRIAYYRAIRAFLKDMVQSFKDLYGYSSAYGTQFQKSMDMVATSMRYFRNSLAAMLAPLIDMLAPVLDMIVDKLVEGMNYVNMFFAALSGQKTYTVAKKVQIAWSDTFDSTSQKAKKTTDDIKRTILGFDEINKLVDPKNNSSGSSSGNSPYTNGYKQMFETLPIPSSMLSFSSALENAINNMFSRIALIVGASSVALGVILLATGHIGPGIFLILSGLTIGAVSLYWDAISNYLNKALGFALPIVGITAIALGVLALVTGHPFIGLALIGAGVVGLSMTSKVSWRAVSDAVERALKFPLSIVGAVAVGLGVLAFLTGHPAIGLGLIGGGITMMGLSAGAAKWDDLKKWGSDAIDHIKQGWEDWKKNHPDAFAVVAAIVNTVSEMWATLVGWWDNFTSGKFLSIGIKASADGDVSDNSGRGWKAPDGSIIPVGDPRLKGGQILTKKALSPVSTEIYKIIKSTTSAVTSTVTGATSTVTGKFSQMGSSIKSQLGSDLPQIESSVTSTAQGIESRVTSTTHGIEESVSLSSRVVEGNFGVAAIGIKALVADMTNSVTNSARTAGNKLVNIMYSACNSLWNIKMEGAGRNIVYGVQNGIAQAQQSLYNQVYNLAYNLSRAFRVSLKIRSPSKVFAESGAMIVAGLAQGISDTSPEAFNAIGAMSNELVGRANAALDDVAGAMGYVPAYTSNDSNDTSVDMSRRIAEALYAQFSALMQQQNDYLRQINDKEFTASVSTADIQRGLNRSNRRSGITVVPVGTGT